MHHTQAQHALRPQASQIPARYQQDWSLVQRCLDQDRAAWAELVEKYEATLFFTIRHTLRARGAEAPDELVADLQADVLMALVKDDFRRLSRYAGRCRLGHWLKVVASNYTIDQLRQRRPTVSFEDPSRRAVAATSGLTDHAPSPEQALQARQRQSAVRALYRELPQEDQRFMDLYLRRELSFEEIARQMDTTVGAIYARKNRVRKKLTALARERGLI
jgi:RNA polymerase sigma-70 factor (ECF subfamily)